MDKATKEALAEIKNYTDDPELISRLEYYICDAPIGWEYSCPTDDEMHEGNQFVEHCERKGIAVWEPIPEEKRPTGPRTKTCKICNGKGGVHNSERKYVACTACNGIGKVRKEAKA